MMEEANREALEPPDQSLVACESQQIWSAMPASLVVIIIVSTTVAAVIVMLSLGLDPDEPLQGAVLGSLFYLIAVALLCFASRKTRGSSRLPFGASNSRTALGHAALLGIPLVGISVALLYAIYIPLSFVFPELVVWWVLDQQPLFWINSDSTYIVASVINAIILVIIAPVVEEIIFRGYLLHRIIIKIGTIEAILISSILFGLLHVDFAGAVIFGVILCCMTLYSRSLKGPMLAHGCNNLIVMMWTLCEGLYEGELVWTMSLDEFYDTWWIGLAGGVIALPWLIWAWCNRRRIKPTEWATPLIKTIEARSKFQPNKLP
ncbi:MAG: CPBP family intramembrane glutamic endopeptidase [Geminicoccaceae bacterium]